MKILRIAALLPSLLVNKVARILLMISYLLVLQWDFAKEELERTFSLRW